MAEEGWGWQTTLLDPSPSRKTLPMAGLFEINKKAMPNQDLVSSTILTIESNAAIHPHAGDDFPKRRLALAKPGNHPRIEGFRFDPGRRR